MTAAGPYFGGDDMTANRVLVRVVWHRVAAGLAVLSTSR
jgi:hypothetical protein